MDIRTILYINIFLLAGCTAGISVIAFHNKRFRQFSWIAVAYAIGCLSTVLRALQGVFPDFFVLVLSNVLVVIALLLVHHCFAEFAKVHMRTGWLEILFVAGALVGLAYYTYVDPSLDARSVLMSFVSAGIATRTFYVLITFADAAVRIPSLATTALYVTFIIMMALRCLGILLWHAPNDFFVSSASQLIGFLGFYILVAGIPVGYFWMTFTRLYANQELLARTDSLTGLLNRRALEEQASREIRRSRRQGTPLAVLSLDLDHFKLVNDQYGHKIGDAVLCSVATLLLRPCVHQTLPLDQEAKEFVVLLANTGKEDAAAMAERLRSTLEGINVDTGKYRLKLTASFGIAMLNRDDSFQSILRRADQALYAAKSAGRNCVMLETEDVSQQQWPRG